MGKPDWNSNRNNQRSRIPSMIALSDLLADHQEFHSDLQMTSFITIRSGGTLYGCYKQALRELSTRKSALIQRYTHRELLLIEIEELESQCANATQIRRNKVHATEKQLTVDECRRVIADTEREFMHFYEQALAIRDALRAAGVSFPLDAATRNRLDSEMWEHQLKCMAAVEFMTCSRLGANTVGLLQSCPVEMRQRIAEKILRAERQSELIDWYLTYEIPIPAPLRLKATDVRKLIECSGS
jgi:hypothetical protein